MHVRNLELDVKRNTAACYCHHLLSVVLERGLVGRVQLRVLAPNCLHPWSKPWWAYTSMGRVVDQNLHTCFVVTLVATTDMMKPFSNEVSANTACTELFDDPVVDNVASKLDKRSSVLPPVLSVWEISCTFPLCLLLP